ncbi:MULTISPECIES: enoyl-CoA hydratase/isomerase family protein [unclassified Streptomyces]|uniref:enoyl-CoA hydratase/isomerase family protein n=1 Tax=unclassified Streptomyces TaxID=2593676 RepID=UPI00081B50B1|nr:enoyl-CoA hydratase/isomerase family protein [Streptomyces sp. DvalAA-43]MYQ85957.1 enoyl-CoA hydratase/isomerase family protein [Streptomyces sp. SID4936]SCE14570.1 Enoyl-CoA hydratase/carnithine racemase [Streptomyces sp. DvalAA-43]
MALRTETDRETGVALVTLDRPEKHNAIDLATAAELAAAWRSFRFDDGVRAVVLTGAGGRAFCTGIDRGVDVPQPPSPYTIDDPLLTIGPKANDLWKPVIAAVEGMACGGAFYLLGEAEFVIASETATFFDPHTTYGMVSAYEAIAMAQRMPFGEVARMSLMGTAERVSARRAYETGLVSEVTAAGGAVDAALRAAGVIASYPTRAVQGTVRAVWSAREAARTQAMAHAPHLIALGNLPPERQAELFRGRGGGEFRTR